MSAFGMMGVPAGGPGSTQRAEPARPAELDPAVARWALIQGTKITVIDLAAEPQLRDRLEERAEEVRAAGGVVRPATDAEHQAFIEVVDLQHRLAGARSIDAKRDVLGYDAGHDQLAMEMA